MAKASKYEYVKAFEQSPTLLRNTVIVIRLDGRAFHKLSTKYAFQKPNDRRALDLMNAAASATMKEISDVILAYGISDEYSFIFDRSTKLFDRREIKIVTTVVSTFTSYYVHLWPTFFPSSPLSPPMPSFDGRAVVYPSIQNIRDYVSWRQADCHINNLYNTTFWALVDKEGKSATQAEEELKGTLAADKNEILFSRFGVNYNDEPEMFRKGSVLFRDVRWPRANAFLPDLIDRQYAVEGDEVLVGPQGEGSAESEVSKTQAEKERKKRQKATITLAHTDLIQDAFWEMRPWLLGGKGVK